MHVRPIVSLTATAVATLALAACGGSGSATKTATSTASTSTAAATTATDSSTASPVATTDSASPTTGSPTTGTDGSGSTQGSTTGTDASGSATPTSGSSSSGHGAVKGASGSLATYLSAQAAKATKDNGCRMTVSVGKRVGSYARGSYFGKGCGGWAATWAKVGGSWQEVYAGQDAPECSVFDAKAPRMPASLGQQCVGKDGKAVTYGASGSGDGDQAGGVVHGGSADLKSFLQGRLTELNKGQSCKYYAEVDKQVGGYASGGFSGCGGTAAFWVRSGGTWHTVTETQDVVQCSDLRSKAPGMPSSIVKECYDAKKGAVVPWKPVA